MEKALDQSISVNLANSDLIEELEAEKKVAFGDGQMNAQIKLAGRIAELEAENAKLREVIALNCDPCAAPDEHAQIITECYNRWSEEEMIAEQALAEIDDD